MARLFSATLSAPVPRGVNDGLLKKGTVKWANNFNWNICTTVNDAGIVVFFAVNLAAPPNENLGI
jgi:hypothetical protein